MSSQTKDAVTDAAIKALRKVLGGSVTVDAIIEAEEEVVAAAINKVGFWRRKAGYEYFLLIVREFAHEGTIGT